MRAKNSEWLTHEYFRTYRIANTVDTIMRDPFAYLRELEGLTVDNGIMDFLPHWQRDSALHKFIRYIADDIFMADSHGPSRVPHGPDPVHPQWILPADLAMMNYGIINEPLFFIPDAPSNGDPFDRTEGNTDSDPYFVQNACSDYLMHLPQLQPYVDLMDRIADEVFFVMFTNRRALASLNKFLSMYLDGFDPAYFGKEDQELTKLFKREGELKRVRPPVWARRAVFYRDRGRCTGCRVNLSGLIDTFDVANYDHMIPLARGGLNDVTNLQLLCEKCNTSKGDRIRIPSNRYRRWY
ncbi:HNH endonuclease [Streptomyces sp. NPDC002564]|uniref:HNH endonuclease n=1 Tax=Streptomyces sp. NPDC002564 TaxID=3364649 RepID=UPI0036A7DEE3